MYEVLRQVQRRLGDTCVCPGRIRTCDNGIRNLKESSWIGLYCFVHTTIEGNDKLINEVFNG
jgi:hypothetical protein